MVPTHIPLAHLWLPIILSAVFVFVVSSLIHMVLKWHNSDYRALPNEDEVRAAIRKGSPTPGQYVIPYCGDMKEMGKPEVQQKYTDGPVGFLMLGPNGTPNMGKALGLWFLYAVAVAFMAAYVASRTLAPGTHYLQVFRVVGAVSFLTYAGGSVQMGIWAGKPWRSVVKDLIDGLLYGLVSAGAFGWLWPKL
ncbi:hypothetical protein [Geothrix campi]|jgi:hypothetical protein|uniref:hypothetical protein n=1 Tax=Geothrix campi TaxID=2966450 RepID=UPI002147B580|nr:hypothetical protein [Geothrix sp. SG10]